MMIFLAPCLANDIVVKGYGDQGVLGWNGLTVWTETGRIVSLPFSPYRMATSEV